MHRLLFLLLLAAPASAQVSLEVSGGITRLNTDSLIYEGPTLDVGATISVLDLPLVIGLEGSVRELIAFGDLDFNQFPCVRCGYDTPTLVARFGTEFTWSLHDDVAVYGRPDIRSAIFSSGQALLLTGGALGVRYSPVGDVAFFIGTEAHVPPLRFFELSIGLKLGVHITLRRSR